jgi:lipopolysaccharide export LptBFGC system permease protein LptF
MKKTPGRIATPLLRAALVISMLLVCRTFAANKPVAPHAAKPATAVADTASKRTPNSQGYVVRLPGEITFTTGAVIEGKIEKPQVMIILPKEKTQADSIIFDQDFRAEMLKPLDTDPRAEATDQKP